MSHFEHISRYFIEEVPEGNCPVIHGYCGGWHGVWLDSNTLYGIIYAHPHRVDKLENDEEPNVTILPSLVDSTDVRQHLKDKGKTKHIAALDKNNVPPNASTHGLAVHMGKLHKHPFFKPKF